MKVRTLTSEQWVPWDIDRVFEFFSDAGNLDAITPPWLHFQVLTPRPIEMKPGALIDYKLKVRWVPMRWQSEIVDWTPPHRFVDVQRRGPYKLWRHEHTFEAKDGGTLVCDRIEYAAPGWFLEPVVHCLFVGPDLRKIFAYRRARLEELLAASA